MVPGHAPLPRVEVAARLAADHPYIDALRRGEEPVDAHLDQDGSDTGRGSVIPILAVSGAVLALPVLLIHWHPRGGVRVAVGLGVAVTWAGRERHLDGFVGVTPRQPPQSVRWQRSRTR